MRIELNIIDFLMLVNSWNFCRKNSFSHKKLTLVALYIKIIITEKKYSCITNS